MRCLLAAVLLLGGCPAKPKPGAIKVAAASDLAYAFGEIGQAFEK